MFQRSKERARHRHDEQLASAIASVRELRERGFCFAARPYFDGEREWPNELFFGDPWREGTVERTRQIATAIGMETGPHGGLAGDPVVVTARLDALIHQWPDGLPPVYAEIDVQVESWRRKGVAEAAIRSWLIGSDLLQDANLDVDDVFHARGA